MDVDDAARHPRRRQRATGYAKDVFGASHAFVLDRRP